MRIQHSLTISTFATALCLLPQTSQAGTTKTQYMLDIIDLQPGVSLAQAKEYFSQIRPIAAKYGAEILSSWHVDGKIMGPIEPRLVNLWRISADSLKSIGQDRDYQSLQGLRDRAFKMNELQLLSLAAKEGCACGLQAGGKYMLDILHLKKGVPLKQADKYFSRIHPITKDHGLSPLASFTVNKSLRGSLRPTLVQVWQIEKEGFMKGIGNDKRYKKNIPLRERTFEMKKTILLNMTAQASL